MKTSAKVTVATKPPQLPENVLVQKILSKAVANGYSFAFWRLPNEHITNLIVSFTPILFSKESSLEELPEGFLFCPFDPQKEGQFLKADLSFMFSDGKLLEPVNPLQASSHDKLQDFLSHEDRQKIKFYAGKEKAVDPLSQPAFEQFVADGIKQIESGFFEKIVPSRSRAIPLRDDFDAIEAFQKLRVAYPNAMVSLVSIPTMGTWVGATPEVLVSVEDNHIFRTVALAGTKPFTPGLNLKQVAWTQKEIEEQALVSRYIISCFKKIRLREFEEHGPKTIVAGNLMHLKTDFMVDMKATNFPQLGSVMLRLLHPTSAVCGMPLEQALQFLKHHETYDREFYSGYLGPVNTNNNIHLFVNLRCMQLFYNHATIYAGAGVTVDSIPSSELEETEIKMNTLLNVIL
jgi:isochorismate synthase